MLHIVYKVLEGASLGVSLLGGDFVVDGNQDNPIILKYLNEPQEFHRITVFLQQVYAARDAEQEAGTVGRPDPVLALPEDGPSHLRM